MPPIEISFYVIGSFKTPTRIIEGQHKEFKCLRMRNGIYGELTTAHLSLDSDKEGGSYKINGSEEVGRLINGETLCLIDLNLELRGGTEEQLKEKSHSFTVRKVRQQEF